MTTTTQLLPLTPRQAKVLKFIRAFFRVNQKTPTIREIGRALQISSPNGVVRHIKLLEQKGWIELPFDNTARGIRLVCIDGKCPLCGKE